MSAAAARSLPRAPLLAAGALVALTLAIVAAVRLSGVSISEPDAAAVAMRELRSRTVPTAASR